MDDDQFIQMMAAMAMQGLIAAEWTNEMTEEEVAISAYEHADAMLAERNRRRAARRFGAADAE